MVQLLYMKNKHTYEIYQCPCEAKEHIIDTSKGAWFLFHEMSLAMGKDMNYTVTSKGKTRVYSIPRIYVYKHELPKPTFKMMKELGFDQYSEE